MPGFGGILEPYHIDDLVALMRSWQQPVGDHLLVEPPKTLPPAVQNPGGPAPAFAAQSGRYVSASDLKTAMDAKAELVVLDARPAGDYPAFHLPGAVSLPFYSAEQLGSQLPKTVWTVTYCACPHAESTALAEALEQQGHQHGQKQGVGWGMARKRVGTQAGPRGKRHRAGSGHASLGCPR